MQAALPCLFMAQHTEGPAGPTPDRQISVLELRGGTDAAMAPPVAYVQQVLLPMLHRLQGVQACIDLQKRGFFPRVSNLPSCSVAHAQLARHAVGSISCELQCCFCTSGQAC